MDQVLLQATRLPHVAQVPRSSTALAYFNDTLFSFGGFSELYHSDLNSADLNSSVGHWLPRQRQPTAPSVRRGHTLTQLSSTKFVLFGGDSENKYMNDLWMYTGVWQKIDPITGDIPTGRYGHCAVLLGDYLYIFGGKNPEEQVLFEDLWSFDFRENKWDEIIEIGPEGRYGCSLTQISSTKALLFGGSCSSGRLNDVWSLSIDGKWEQLIENELLEAEPRTEHGACSLGEGFLCVFGGFSQEKPLNDCWVIEIAASASYRLDTSEFEFFSPRHAFGYVEKSEFMGIGEASTFQALYDGNSVNINNIDPKPVYSANETTVYVFGGAGENGEKLGDLYKLDFCCLARSSEAETADFLKSQMSRNMIEAKMDEMRMEAERGIGAAGAVSVDELSAALSDFEEAVVDAFGQFESKMTATDGAERQIEHRQQLIEGKFSQLDASLEEFLKDAQITQMMHRITELEREKTLMLERIERIENAMLKSDAIAIQDKQEWIQQNMGLQREMGAPDADCVEEQLKIGMEAVDNEVIENSVIRITTDEFDRIESILEQCKAEKLKYDRDADCEGLSLDDIDSHIRQLDAGDQ